MLCWSSLPRGTPLLACGLIGGCTALLGIDEDYVWDPSVGLGGQGGQGADAGAAAQAGSGGSGAAGGSGAMGGGGDMGGSGGAGGCLVEDCGASCTCSGQCCELSCAEAPCAVTCDSGATCTAVCADATCLCTGDSICVFDCSEADCNARCLAGASCVLDCGSLAAGTSECDFQNCHASVTACPDGRTLTCNAPCP